MQKKCEILFFYFWSTYKKKNTLKILKGSTLIKDLAKSAEVKSGRNCLFCAFRTFPLDLR